jgi:hypothetical protein
MCRRRQPLRSSAAAAAEGIRAAVGEVRGGETIGAAVVVAAIAVVLGAKGRLLSLHPEMPLRARPARDLALEI